jgi:putative ABC transport system substrate-binding protein
LSRSSPLTLVAAFIAAEAQPAGKLPLIGNLRIDSASQDPHWLEQDLREHGYVEDQNIAIEKRYAEGRPERLPMLAAELVHLKVDVIFAGTPETAVPAKKATKAIPIVFAVGNPVAEGLVASLARPGGNLTGLTSVSSELSAKRLELLKEITPAVSRVAVLLNPVNPTHPGVMREIEAAAQVLGIELQPLAVRRASDFVGAFRGATEGRAGGLVVLNDSLLLAERAQIARFAAKSRLPAVYGFREQAAAGGLMSYGVDLRNQYRRAVTYIVKILKGAKPADLPIEQPTKFELVVNLKTAKALGLTIPQSVLLRADEVIQ